MLYVVVEYVEHQLIDPQLSVSVDLLNYLIRRSGEIAARSQPVRKVGRDIGREANNRRPDSMRLSSSVSSR